MDESSNESDLCSTVRELEEFRESVTSKTGYVGLEIKLISLLDTANRRAKKKNENDFDLKEYGQTLWGLSYAIILNCPSSMTWPLALNLATSFLYVSKELPSPLPLLSSEAVREAKEAYVTEPLIPKAFASLLIAMVAQQYVTIDDLEGIILALLQLDWPMEELIFIGKSLEEISLMLGEKLDGEVKIQLMLDWISETISGIVADLGT